MTSDPSAHAPHAGDEFFTNDRTTGQEAAIVLPEGGYEEFRFAVDDPLLARYRGLRYDDYARERVAPSFVQDLLGDWERLYQEPFRGVTSDGAVKDHLYSLPRTGASSPQPRLAAERAMATLDGDERDRFWYDLDAREWRAWSNPEFMIHQVGLRLEDLDDSKVAAIVDLVRACLSAEGYELVRELMDLNGFLGSITDLPTIMNARSYSIALFGTPSDAAPWGWQLFGHHVALNFLSMSGRQVVAPVFLGAEPAVSLDGRPPVFADRVALALELAGSLTPEERADAVVFDSVLDAAMPADRLHPADERHVAGAFRDNRVIPYEGISAARMSSAQWSQLRQLIADFLVLLVEPQREATLADVDAHRDETHFSWYGATDGSQPFYFRIHGPVILAELDHHAGVWLTNQLPARFHIHTMLRLPNGNDYARKYIAQWRERTGTASIDDKWVD